MGSKVVRSEGLW